MSPIIEENYSAMLGKSLKASEDRFGMEQERDARKAENGPSLPDLTHETA